MPPAAAPSLADPFDAGPFARIEARIARAALHRAGAAAAIAWLPLLVLSAVQGSLMGGPGAFLPDVRAHGHYLLALPVLFLAEPWCLVRLALVRRQFTAGGLVIGDAIDALDGLAARARRSLDHRGVEVALLLGVYVASILLTTGAYPRDVQSWVMSGGGVSAAGWWRALVSHPLLLLMIAAWLWRLWVWARFLVGVSRLPLRMVASHPDLAGGLGFVAVSLRAFAPVAGALGVVASSAFAERLLVAGRAPPPAQVGAVLCVVLFLFVAPLVVFAIPLHRVRLRGLLEYGALAAALGQRFEQRWLRSDDPVSPAALGAPDFSATTDLYSVAANVWRMKLVPIGSRDLLLLALATLLPFVPLALLVMPVDEVLRGLIGLLL
jgi:hypothetical protein